MISKVKQIPRYLSSAVRTGLRDALGWTYSLPNPQLGRTLGRPIASLNQVYSLVSEHQIGSSYIVRGKEVNSDLPLTVGLVGIWETGQRNTLPLFQHLLFKEGTAEPKDLGSFSLWRIRSVVETLAKQVDLLLVNANNLVLWEPTHGDWVRGPAELRMVFEYHTGETWQDVERRLKSQRGNLKKLKRSKFSYRISRSDKDFSQFYHEFYVPMVKSRYKDYGDINREAGLRKLFRERGVLLFIQDAQGETISAEFDYVKRRVLYALLTGVRGGDPELIRKGALAACYYYSFHYGFVNGCRRNDAGVCLPFLSDGVLQHKLLWGYQPLPNDWRPQTLLLWAPHSTPAALEWLKANPFLPQFAQWGGPNMHSIYTPLPQAQDRPSTGQAGWPA